VNLSVIYITSREKPLLEWFFDSLRLQVKPNDRVQVIVVRLIRRTAWEVHFWNGALIVEPKPTVWQGPHRVTSKNWWAASNSRNTGICLAQHAWLSFLDDRCVLLPGWLDCIRQAQAGKYAVFGSYEKRTGMVVEGGVIKHSGIVIGEDSREKYVREHWAAAAPVKCPGEWSFGCNIVCPLEWALAVNGFDEICDGAGFEDPFFGLNLEHSGYPTYYDHRMRMIEDRTPEELGEPIMKRDKGLSPYDKSHQLQEMLVNRKTASHPINLRAIRADVMRGLPFPMPWGPTHDFFDNQPIAEMV
jgi:hypothetical protein